MFKHMKNYNKMIKLKQSLIMNNIICKEHFKIKLLMNYY